MAASDQDKDSAVLAVKIEAMGSDLQEIKSAMKELVSAVSRLAVVEERQTATNDAIGRAFKDIGTLAGRVATLEQSQPIQKQSSDMVQTAIKYIVVALLGAIVAGFVRVPPALPSQNAPAIHGK